LQPDAPLLVFYDEDCGYCRWSVAQLLRLDRDRRLRLIAIQSPLGERLLADVPEDLRLESAHLIDGEGKLFSGGEAAAPIAAALPSLAPAAPLLGRLSRPVNASYKLVAANREQFGRLVGSSARERADRAIAAHQAEFRSEAQ
jgi:predicted DCC family thiol-disulfide oxidoreductase YuxK